ncbi:MAG TPA: alpha/beta fold hydrolase [Polyangiales bacterium]|nr:alpha/beta fold hydrolase [Polyangiales bacterium]
MLTLTPHIEGASAGPTLFFIQGWPDDSTLWEPLVATLCDRYRCVRIELPNSRGAPYARWGFENDEVVAALAACIREVSPRRPLTLIAHDWGAFWSYRLHVRYPELVSRLVALDIGPSFRPNPREAAFIVAYQWWLIAAFVLGGRLGDGMTRAFARLSRTPRQGAEIGARLNYPYFHTWKELLTGKLPNLSHYAPEVPFLMVYGAKKPARFHTLRWLDYLRSRPENEVIELAEQGHWVMRDPSFNRRVKQFLDRTQA